MLDTSDEEVIERFNIDQLDLGVRGQRGRVDGVLEMLGAPLHYIVEVVVLRDEQDLDGASLLHQELAAALGQLDHLILVGQLQELLHVECRDRLVWRIDHLQ
jgi:hypothetical protein